MLLKTENNLKQTQYWSTAWSSRFLPTEWSGPAGEVRKPLDLLTDKHFHFCHLRAQRGSRSPSQRPGGGCLLLLFLPHSFRE